MPKKEPHASSSPNSPLLCTLWQYFGKISLTLPTSFGCHPQNIIRAEEAERRPFVGDLEPLDALKAEYENGSSVFVQKISSLATTYGNIRRTRGDGNCFFRRWARGDVVISAQIY